MKQILLLLLIGNIIYAGEKLLVNIAPGIGAVPTYDHGVKINIERIQDTFYRLTDDFTKTSRPCPPFCVQPMKPVKGVHNIEELELIDFIEKKIPVKRGGIDRCSLKELV